MGSTLTHDILKGHLKAKVTNMNGHLFHQEVRMDARVGMPPKKGGDRKIVVLYVDRFPETPIHTKRNTHAHTFKC